VCSPTPAASGSTSSSAPASGRSSAAGSAPSSTAASAANAVWGYDALVGGLANVGAGATNGYLNGHGYSGGQAAFDFGAGAAGALGGRALAKLGGKVWNALQRARTGPKPADPTSAACTPAQALQTAIADGLVKSTAPQNHLNGATAKELGWQAAKAKGHIGIQAPGKITATGPDYSTFNPADESIYIWDAKYSINGTFPSTSDIPATKLQAWMPWLNNVVAGYSGAEQAAVRDALAARPDQGKHYISMGDTFDWKTLQHPRWTPLSRFGVAAQPVVRKLYAAGAGIYLMTNSGFGGTAEDPGVAAVLWAQSRAAALLVYDSVLDADLTDGGTSAPPPVGVVGFEPLTFSAIVTQGKAAGGRPMATADFRFPDGRFVVSRVITPEREYIFASREPGADERPIAIEFGLSAN